MGIEMKMLCSILIFCSISLNFVNCETYKIKLDQQEDFHKVNASLISGMDNGNISVHHNSSGIDIEYNAFKLNSRKVIISMAKNESHLFVAKEGDGILACPFDFSNLTHGCIDKARKLDVDVPKVSGLVVVGNTLYFVTQDGHHGRCNLYNGICFKSKQFVSHYSGISYDSNYDELYVSSDQGYGFRCRKTEARVDFDCTNVFEHLGTTYRGVLAVHVAFESVWLGTRNGRLLKCSLAERKDKLDCDEFIEFEWKWFFGPKPVVVSVAFKNGQLFAHVKGDGSNRVLQCNPNEPKSCTAFKLLEGTKSFLIV